MSYLQKIDFFGGLHGNFLELVVNVAINQSGYDISKPQFTKDGACHLKNHDSSYTRIAVANHYSFFKIPFDKTDIVIQIVPTVDDLLISFVNSFLRAGDQMLDIDNLEKDTINKMLKLPKTMQFKDTIIKDHGVRVDYPRASIRNYFYSVLSDFDNGLDMLTKFDPDVSVAYQFPFRAFFEIGNFYQELNKLAKFLNLDFFPSKELGRLHKEFIAHNQGFQCETRCKKIWQAILFGESIDIKLNILEEAWINHMISSCFRCYDHPLLIQDQYPTNTLEISQTIFEWKSKTAYQL
jgi:hypothetical protein